MKYLISIAVCVALVSCASWLGNAVNDSDVELANQLAHCQDMARDAGDGGHVKAYNDCKAEAGIK